MNNKRPLILVYALFGLIIVSISISLGFEYFHGQNKWLGLIIGVIFMAVGIVLYGLGKRQPFTFYLSFLFNMTGVGLSITSYYVFKEYSLTLYDYIFAIIVSLSLLIGFSLLTLLKAFNRHIKWLLAGIILISFITSLVLWLSSNQFSGLSFYYLNVTYFFMVGIISSINSAKDLSQEMAFISFGAFILISIIVIIIISEGEALNGLDGADFGPRKKKKNT